MTRSLVIYGDRAIGSALAGGIAVRELAVAREERRARDIANSRRLASCKRRYARKNPWYRGLVGWIILPLWLPLYIIIDKALND